MELKVWISSSFVYYSWNSRTSLLYKKYCVEFSSTDKFPDYGNETYGKKCLNLATKIWNV